MVSEYDECENTDLTTLIENSRGIAEELRTWVGDFTSGLCTALSLIHSTIVNTHTMNVTEHTFRRTLVCCYVKRKVLASE